MLEGGGGSRLKKVYVGAGKVQSPTYTLFSIALVKTPRSL